MPCPGPINVTDKSQEGVRLRWGFSLDGILRFLLILIYNLKYFNVTCLPLFTKIVLPIFPMCPVFGWLLYFSGRLKIKISISALPTDNRFALHSVAVCLLALHGALMSVAAIDDYVIQVCFLQHFTKSRFWTEHIWVVFKSLHLTLMNLSSSIMYAIVPWLTTCKWQIKL